MDVLGIRLDAARHSQTCCEHRLSCASGTFGKYKTLLTSAETPLVASVCGYQRAAQSSALHGAEVWALDGARLHRLRGWGTMKLTQVGRFRKPAPRPWTVCRHQVGAIIKAWNYQLGSLSLFQRAFVCGFSLGLEIEASSSRRLRYLQPRCQASGPPVRRMVG